jgi:hypothetical protein
MRRIGVLAAVLTIVVAGCSSDEAGEVDLRWEFTDDLGGWTVGFTDYTVELEPMETDSGIAPLPEGLGEEGSGLLISGWNTSDDLFMFTARGIGPDDGIVPGTAYRSTLRFAVASGSPSNCVGIGGAPGEGVTMKAGVVAAEPGIDLEDGEYRFSLDKGNQTTGGSDLAVLGDVANGIECEEALSADPPPFRVLTFELETDVSTDDEGRIWVVIGSDSGFEGTTALYYRWVELTLEPQ